MPTAIVSDAEVGRLGGEQVAAEAIAVALDDRHEAGAGLEGAGDASPPAGRVDVELEAALIRVSSCRS